MNRRRFVAGGVAGLLLPLAGIRPASADEGDDPTDNMDPGCPAPDCFYQRTWQDVNHYGCPVFACDWGPNSRLEGNINDCKLVSIPHEAQYRKIKCNFKLRADGDQYNDVYFRCMIVRSVTGIPDPWHDRTDQPTHGDPGTWEVNCSVIVQATGSNHRYYGRVEVWRGGNVLGWLNGPKSPAWHWVP